ncbi:MAG TPA: chordopoxvirus fusion protein [Deltaproteobacteria bacterium]|nr:chordopoxvirus fusion protein [Deltaproteobacteria bacterium]
MINTFSIYEDLRECLGDEAAGKLAAVMGKVYEDIAQTVTKKEFIELTDVVRELAEAQKRTEARVEELAEAQRRTEARIEELTKAQKHTEQRLDSLTVKVEELTEAQKHTEQILDSLTVKVEELAEAQKKTETRIEELAEAQKRTEKALGQLIRDHSETRKRLESMSDAVGYNLEDRSYKSLPKLLLRDTGIQVEGRLIRRYFPGKRNGQYIQANIYGWGKRNGDKVLILGEAKTSISRREISRFQKLVKRISDMEKVPFEKVVQVIVVYDVTPNIEEYAKEKGIHIYWSYEL